MSFLGKLSLDAIPYHEPIIMVTLAVVAVVGLYIAALITKHKKWSVLWNNWLTSVDHKRLGIMYIVLALVMLIRGFSDAIMMRTQQALATNGAAGYLPPEHYDQIFTRPRRDHDYLYGDAIYDRSNELSRAAADWRTRRCLPLLE